jgi:hypothetical protein
MQREKMLPGVASRVVLEKEGAANRCGPWLEKVKMEGRRRLAILVTAALGGVLGLLVEHAVSWWAYIHGAIGSWNSPDDYCPWIAIGLTVGGVGSLAFHLWRPLR